MIEYFFDWLLWYRYFQFRLIFILISDFVSIQWVNVCMYFYKFSLFKTSEFYWKYKKSQLFNQNYELLIEI